MLSSVDISLLYALVIISLGTVLQTWFGIGLGLIAGPLLFLINPAFVPTSILVSGFVLSCLVVYKSRHNLGWQRILPAIVARIPGSWFGAILLTLISTRMLAIFFGCALLFATLLSWKTVTLKTNRLNLMIGGFFSGVIGTSTSVGGPPIALVYQQQTRHQTRNELAVFFLIGTPVSLLMLWLEGRINQQQIELTTMLLPGVLVGYSVAKRFEEKINIQSAKPALLVISALSALVVIKQGISD